MVEAWSPVLLHHVLAAALLLLAASLVFLALGVAVRRWRFVRALASVPGPDAWPVLGNALILMGGQDDFFRLLQQCAAKYGECFVLWVGQRPFVFLQSAEAVQPILNSTLHIDKSYEYSFFFPWLGSGLVTNSGSKWHARRKLLTPSFHARVLADFASPVQRCARVLVTRLALAAQTGQPVDVLLYAKRCTLDLMCETTMGHHTNIQLEENSDYNNAITELSTILQRRFITPWLKPDVVFNATSLGRRHKRCVRTVHAFTDRVIEERRKELQRRLKSNGNFETSHVNTKGKPRLALLDLLLEMQTCETPEGATLLSDTDIRDEVNTFLFAGHDTTAAGLSWCLYVLGHHPEVQERVVEEVRNATAQEPDGELNFRTTQHMMPLLESCIRECMRLFPQVPLIARDLKHPVTVGSHTLPAGVTVLMNLYLLHRDPRFFPEPDRFIPERFLSHTAGPQHPFAYIPFSAGPRNCIGQRFAMLQLKILVAEVLLGFEVRAETAPERLNLMGELVLLNKDSLRLWLTPRQ